MRYQDLTLDQANYMAENVVATFALPYTTLPDVIINGQSFTIPFVSDNADLLISTRNGIAMARMGGGFATSSTLPVMIGQIQVLDVPDFKMARQRVLEARTDIIDWLNTRNPATVSRHAHATGLDVREISSDDAFNGSTNGHYAELMSNSTLLLPVVAGSLPDIRMLIVHLYYDCADAMGANLINTACESIAARIELLTGGRVNLCILSNLSDRRRVKAMCSVPAAAVHGQAKLIVDGTTIFEQDVAWTAAHNKIVLDAVVAVVMATGNDWRAVDAAAFAYAMRNGRMESLVSWKTDRDGSVVGQLDLPLAVGIVGGATRVHPLAQISLQLIKADSARSLAETIACAGLASSLAFVVNTMYTKSETSN